MPRSQKTGATYGSTTKAVAVGIPLLIFYFSGFCFFQSCRSLASFAVAQGEIIDSKVIQINGRTRPFVAYFRLRNTAVPFGIYCGQNREQAGLLISRISPGKLIKVYYDAADFTADDVNLRVAQVEKENHLIYAIDESRSQDLFMGKAFLVLGIAFTIGITLSMREKNRHA